MRDAVLVAAGGFTPPGAGDLDLDPIISGVGFFTKPVLLLIVAVVLVAGFFALGIRRQAMVPSKFQFIAETAYSFVRNSLARDIIGSQQFKPYVPLLLSLFFFILVSNLFGLFFLTMYPPMARVAFPYVLAVIVLVVFVSAGMRKHGVGGYLKMASMPSGLPKAVYPLVVPMEFASTFLIRPVTLSLRLFANMFAGHLLILVFALGGAYLLTQGPLMAVFGVTSMGFGVLISFLKLLIAFLQAYIFTLLAALYIAGATADEH